MAIRQATAASATPAHRWASTSGMSSKLSSVACMKPSATVTSALIAPAIQAGATALSRDRNGRNRTRISSATANVSMPKGKCTSKTWNRPRNQMNCMLGDDLFDHLAGGVGQAEIAALVVEGQLLVVEPQEVEHGRVYVVNLDRILDDVVAELVGLAVGDARL